MKINENVSSLRILNSMGKLDTKLRKSIERLSSGCKINTSADDASGLAISRKMQVQINALDRAEENAEDGVSLIQTAEGALNEVHSILQRIRELSVQASNGTLTPDDRASVQSEVGLLTDELDRISSSIQYNNINLLDGSCDLKTFSSDENIAKTIYTSDGVVPGHYSFKVDELATKASGITSTIFDCVMDQDGLCTVSGTMKINGVEADIKAGMTSDQMLERISKACEASRVKVTCTTGKIGQGSKLIFESMNPGENEVSVTGSDMFMKMFGLDNVNDKSKAVCQKTIDSTSSILEEALDFSKLDKNILINGVQINITNNMATYNDVLDKIVASDIPGVKALKNDDGTYTLDYNYLEIEGDTLSIASDLKDKLDAVTSDSKPNGTSLLGLTKGRNAKVTITSFDDTSSNEIIGFPEGATVSTEGDIIKFKARGGFELTAQNNNKLGSVDMIITKAGALDFQIGSNEGQTMVVKIPNMSSKALGVEKLNLENESDAEKAISMIDNAILRVSEVRAKLGAFQNRLEHTVNSLINIEENLTSALSRIQDTDMAEEMTNYTQYSILHEASMSILTQANQRPQGLLQLLQNM